MNSGVLRKTVTEAIAQGECRWHGTYVDGQSTYRSKCEMIADAVIPAVKRAIAEAQLEPSPAMVEAGRNALSGGDKVQTHCRAMWCWEAMLRQWWRENGEELS